MQPTDSQTVFRTESQAQLPPDEVDASPLRENYASTKKQALGSDCDFDSQSFVLRYVVQNTLKNTPFRQLKNVDGA